MVDMKMNGIELRQKATDLKRKLAEMRFDKATGKLIDTTAPRKLRRELARILTRESQITSKE